MTIRHTVAALGIAAAIAGLGGAAVYAATDSQGPGHGGGPPNAEGGPPPWMDGPRDRTAPATLHSETVLAGDGGYTTELTQNGTITKLTATSVTVRSNDGFTQSYVLPTTVTPSFGIDDRVLIKATRTGPASTGEPTVTSIGQAPNPRR